MKKLLLILAFVSSAFGQGPSQPTLTLQGAFTVNHCLKIVNARFVADAGGNCGSGSISSGTTNRVPKYTAATTLGNSQIIDTGSLITLPGAVTFSGFTLGSIPFFGTGGAVAQDNANLFWDNTNKYLGIGTIAPSSGVDVEQQISSSAAQSIGISANVVGTGSAAFTSLFGSYFNVGVNGTSTATSAYGVFVDTGFSSHPAGIGTNYGIFVADQNDSDITTNYAIKTGLGIVEHDDATVVIYDNAKSGYGSAINGENDCTVDTNVNCSGVEGDAIVKGAGKTFTNVAGVIGTASFTAASTVTTAVAGQFVPATSLSGSTLTNNYGLWVNGDTNVTATSKAALKIDNQTGTALAISTGTGKVQFGDSLYAGPAEAGFNADAQSYIDENFHNLTFLKSVSSGLIAAFGSTFQDSTSDTAFGNASHLEDTHASGAKAQAIGLYSDVTTAGAGTYDEVDGGFFGINTVDGKGAITNAIAIHATSPNASTQVITNNYGLFIDGMTTGITNYAIRTAAGLIEFDTLKTTGAATGKKIVCVDTSTGILYASSSGVACAN